MFKKQNLFIIKLRFGICFYSHSMGSLHFIKTSFRQTKLVSSKCDRSFRVTKIANRCLEALLAFHQKSKIAKAPAIVAINKCAVATLRTPTWPNCFPSINT